MNNLKKIILLQAALLFSINVKASFWNNTINKIYGTASTVSSVANDLLPGFETATNMISGFNSCSKKQKLGIVVSSLIVIKLCGCAYGAYNLCNKFKKTFKQPGIDAQSLLMIPQQEKEYEKKEQQELLGNSGFWQGITSVPRA